MSIGTNRIVLYVNNTSWRNNVIYFDSFSVELIPKDIKRFIGNKNTIKNIFRVQAYDSKMCGYFWIGFIDYVPAGKTFTDCTNLFSPHHFEKNDRVILDYFKV